MPYFPEACPEMTYDVPAGWNKDSLCLDWKESKGEIMSNIMMMHNLLGASLALSLMFAHPLIALSADTSYPTKPIRLIIPFPPGGSSDIVGRPIAIKLSERLGKSVFIDNRGGAGSVIGTEVAARAVPDGYTLLLINATYARLPAIQKLRYDPKTAFIPISQMARGVNALVVHPSVPVNTVKELIALAKSKPGQVIFSSTGIASAPHLAAELFKMKADIDILIVQFKGANDAMIDLLGGHSHASFSTLLQAVPHVKSGKLKILATTGLVRSATMPGVPTVAEAALPGFQTQSWWGIGAPAGTPAPIIERLNREIKDIMALDEIKKLLLDEGAEVHYLGTTDFSSFIDKEIDTLTSIIKDAKIQIN
jgi:tripartite-type tricarboxylate transporter receptor subunit TctC